MEVDDAVLASPIEHNDSNDLTAAPKCYRISHSLTRSNALVKVEAGVKSPELLQPSPELVSKSADDLEIFEVQEVAQDSSLLTATPFKLEVSDTEDEDSRDETITRQLERRYSTRRQILRSSSKDQLAQAEDCSSTTLKRKHYEVRRSGSDECLLGFDEQSGEAELVKGDDAITLLNYNASGIKLECEEMVGDLTPRTSASASKKTKQNSTSLDDEQLNMKTTSQNVQKELQMDVEKGAELMKAHIVADNEEITNISTDSVHSILRSADSLTLSQSTTVPKKPLSAQDDFYKKPFEYGWKRELVWRANMETSKDKADVYFITPSGKKLRTRTDIVPLLDGELTIDHFSFAREPLGVGTEFELVRSAKPSSRVSITAATLASAPTPTNSKRISKPKGPKGASPPPQGWTPTRALKVNNAALLSSTASSRYGSGGTSNAASTLSSRSGTNLSAINKGNKSAKKHANDIENDLKQINDSIRNSRTTPTEVASLSYHTPPSNTVPTCAVACEHSNNIFASNFFANVSFAYDALLCILKYLKIHERPRAASVCKLWNLAAKDTSLWHTVRMKNSKVWNWTGFAAALRRGETKHLDLRKMLLASTRVDEMWHDFSVQIGTVCSLEVIDLCRCSARVVDSLFQSNIRLRVLNAVAINDDEISLKHIGLLQGLEELRLRTCEPGILSGDLLPLQTLTQLAHLSITAIRGLGIKGVEVFGQLTALRSLELGECADFDSTFAEAVLPKLLNLQRLRLENGQETGCCTLVLLSAVARLEQLTQLELVNFDIKPGFDTKLSQCKNIRKLLIIPTYISQSATTNHIVLSAVQQVAKSLHVFTWGVTVELLRVTALYVQQCEESTKKEKHHFDECIPVLKPVPGAPPADMDQGTKSVDIASQQKDDELGPNEVPQIEILPLDQVESILAENLRKTKFAIVKVPYHITCKQQLVE